MMSDVLAGSKSRSTLLLPVGSIFYTDLYHMVQWLPTAFQLCNFRPSWFTWLECLAKQGVQSTRSLAPLRMAKP